jgi:serine/threonine-protein kinase HipA
MPARVRKVSTASVFLWGREIGAVTWDGDRRLASFEYTPAFRRNGLEVAPLMMPVREGIFSFPNLNPETFRGLPGLLADVLPDRFGNKLIDLWLQQHGRAPDDFSPVERLCYIGSRGMGALEFKPALAPAGKAVPLEVAELTDLAREIVADRNKLLVNLRGERREALNVIIRIGTSAGGARAKAVIAWNPQTKEVRSGQVNAPKGFEPWILKFDGVRDNALGDPQEFGRIEYVYHQMAVKAGIEMSPCHLLKEGSRAHFMTRRFDRGLDGARIHMQSLCAIGHYDFNAPGAYSYEQALSVIQRLNLGYPIMGEMFRRMVFNVVARNQDDHTRNIAFLMDPDGHWRLSPAFDVIWAYNSGGNWTNRHQMRVNGKLDDFDRADLMTVAEQYGIKNAGEIIGQVGESVAHWPELAREAEVPSELVEMVRASHRLNLARPSS